MSEGDRAGSKELLVRLADKSDSADILRLRNEDSARQQFFDPREITKTAHERWYNNALGSDEHLILVLETPPGSLAGYCRFTIVEDSAEISVCLGVSLRGRGLGVELIREACSTLVAGHSHVIYINALVKPENTRSIKAFARAGFIEQGFEDVSGFKAVRLVLLADDVADSYLKMT